MYFCSYILVQQIRDLEQQLALDYHNELMKQDEYKQKIEKYKQDIQDHLREKNNLLSKVENLDKLMELKQKTISELSLRTKQQSIQLDLISNEHKQLMKRFQEQKTIVKKINELTTEYFELFMKGVKDTMSVQQFKEKMRQILNEKIKFMKELDESISYSEQLVNKQKIKLLERQIIILQDKITKKAVQKSSNYKRQGQKTVREFAEERDTELREFAQKYSLVVQVMTVDKKRQMYKGKNLIK